MSEKNWKRIRQAQKSGRLNNYLFNKDKKDEGQGTKNTENAKK